MPYELEIDDSLEENSLDYDPKDDYFTGDIGLEEE